MQHPRKHRFHLVALATSLVTSQLLLGSAAAAPSHVLTGEVIGHGHGNATVAVYALNDTGEQVEAVRIGVSETDSAGRFAVDGGLGREVSRNPDGSITLEVSVFHGGGRKFFSMDAFPPEAGHDPWRLVTASLHRAMLPDVALERGAPGVTIAARNVPFHLGSGTAAASKEPAATDTTTLDGSETETGTVTTMAASDCGKYYHYVWVPTSISTTRFVPIQAIRTRQRASQTYSWNTTKRTRMQVAYAGVGTNYAGGLSYSNVHDTSAGAKTAPAKSYWAGFVKADWRYRLWKQICWKDGSPARYDTGERKWVPRNWTGGFKRNTDSSVAMWKCPLKYKTEVGGTLWVARSTATRHGGEFSIAGVGLDGWQDNSSSHKLSVTRLAGRSLAKICGNNADPIYANRIQEVL